MNKKLVLVFLIFAVAVFAAGQAFAADASFVVEAVNALQDNYVDPLDRCALFNSAIDGLEETLKEAELPAELESIPEDKCPDAQNRFIAAFAKAVEAADGSQLDKTKLAFESTHYMAVSLNDGHVYFLTPERHKEHEEMLTGKIGYADIGITLYKTDGNIYVAEVFEEAPASGLLRPFDRIVAVDGQEIETDTTMGDMVDMIRGDENSWFSIAVMRKGIPEPLGFNLRRALVKPPVVSGEMLEDKVGYLKIRTFLRRGISNEVNSKIKKLSDDGMKAIILDLRGNAGGVLQEVMIIAGAFFPKKTVLCRDRDNKKEEEVLVDRSMFQAYLSKENIPVVLLVNGGSASGSEILAAAMQEYGRATLVGEKTAMIVDEARLFTLSEDAGMVITTKRIITPKGVILGKVGVTPDVEAPFDPKDYALARDGQLFRALEIAKSKIK